LLDQDNFTYHFENLIGLLNSKFISFWFFATFAKHQRKLFPQFKVKELEIFPIPRVIDRITREKTETLIEKIISRKQYNKDSCLEENQIASLFTIFTT
jgi:hypothetical protein